MTDRILHLDFLSIDPDKPVSINVPVVLTGNSIGVREVEKCMYEQKIARSCPLDDLPDSLNIDVTKLALGSAIAAGDLKLDNLQILTPKTTLVCMVKMTRASISDAAAMAEEEGEEGTEGASETAAAAPEEA